MFPTGGSDLTETSSSVDGDHPLIASHGLMVLVSTHRRK